MPPEQLKPRRRHKHLVVAVIDDEASVVAAVRNLNKIGIKNDQVSLLALDTQAIQEAIRDIGRVEGQDVQAGQPDRGAETLAEETSVKGRDEVEGMAVGGCIGLLIGLSVFAIPGFGAALLAAGPVVMAVNVLAHTTAGGIGLGLLLGAILDERVTEEHREYYRERLNHGHWLLVINGDDPLIERAADAISGEHVERVETF